jgi:hypothetical protein
MSTNSAIGIGRILLNSMGKQARERRRERRRSLARAFHVHVYDSAVAPMQFGENLPSSIERYNSLFCECGHVAHFGTQIQESERWFDWQEGAAWNQ